MFTSEELYEDDKQYIPKLVPETRDELISKIDINPDLSTEQHSELLNLIVEFIDVFNPQIQAIDCEPMHIDIMDGAHIKKQWARHFSPPINEEVERQIAELLEKILSEDLIHL